MAKRIYVVDDEAGECVELHGQGGDVTDAVGALYDLAVSSMDFRSGFWSYEDAAPVACLAEAMNYESRHEIVKYRDDQLHNTESSAFIRDWLADNSSTDFFDPGGYAHRINTGFDMRRLEHEHIFSNASRCMWPGCGKAQDGTVS